MSIIQTTIDDLRNTIVPNVNDTYYVTDLGKEGNWRYDANDLLSVDNTGITLVGQGQYRFKRIFDGYVNVKWFGAVGNAWPDNINNCNNDSDAIQLAINTMLTPIVNGQPNSQNQTISETKGGLFFPAGFYLIDKTIKIKSTSIYIEDLGKVNIIGAGSKSTFIIGRVPEKFTITAPDQNSIVINVDFPIFEVFNFYTEFKDLALIGQFIDEGHYKIDDGPYTTFFEDHYFNTGIRCVDNAHCEIENVSFRCLEIGLEIKNSLLHNVNNCFFGVPVGAEDSDIGNDRKYFACNYGIYFSNLSPVVGNATLACNAINIFQCKFTACKIWGISFADGNLLNITNCQFEDNGKLFEIPGNPIQSTGAIRLIGYETHVKDINQYHISGCWFERNYGYHILYNASNNVILNLTNNFINRGNDTLNLNLFGVLINTNPSVIANDVPVVKKVNLIGNQLYSIRPNIHIQHKFFIAASEVNQIGNYFDNSDITTLNIHP